MLHGFYDDLASFHFKDVKSTWMNMFPSSIGLKCGSGGVKALSLNKSSSLKIELQDSPKCCVRLINRTDATSLFW